ncbi:Mannosyl-oligosaccharide glucosidase [Geodia barretti]|nr:Mannosyl-oligosaccharide glucosidase [Geodia barretti]
MAKGKSRKAAKREDGSREEEGEMKERSKERIGNEGKEYDDGGSKPQPPVARKQQRSTRNVRGRGREGGGRGRMPVHYVVLPALLFGGVAIVVYFGEMWWAGPGVNKPLPLPRAVSETWRNDSVYLTRLWGTYRSNVYFGIRPRVPRSLLAGIMWYSNDGSGRMEIRHSCQHGDDLRQYGWIRHDGTSYGQQRIVDHEMMLETEFLTMANTSLGETWSARIRGKPLSQRPILTSLIVYLFNEGKGEMAYRTSGGQRSLEEVYGHTPEFRQFRLYLPRKTVADDAHHSYLAARVASPTHLDSFFKSVMVVEEGPRTWPPLPSLPGEITPDDGGPLKPNLVAYQ